MHGCVMVTTPLQRRKWPLSSEDVLSYYPIVGLHILLAVPLGDILAVRHAVQCFEPHAIPSLLLCSTRFPIPCVAAPLRCSGRNAYLTTELQKQMLQDATQTFQSAMANLLLVLGTSAAEVVEARW